MNESFLAVKTTDAFCTTSVKHWGRARPKSKSHKPNGAGYGPDFMLQKRAFILEQGQTQKQTQIPQVTGMLKTRSWSQMLSLGTS